MFLSLSVYFAGPLFAPQSSTNDDIRKSKSNVGTLSSSAKKFKMSLAPLCLLLLMSSTCFARLNPDTDYDCPDQVS